MEQKERGKKEIQEWLKKNEAKELEKTLKAIANKRRLGILKFLKERGEAPVQEIAEALNLSFKSTSRHIAVLSSSDMLEKEQRSTKVFYRISKEQHPVTSRAISVV